MSIGLSGEPAPADASPVSCAEGTGLFSLTVVLRAIGCVERVGADGNAMLVFTTASAALDEVATLDGLDVGRGSDAVARDASACFTSSFCPAT